ARLLSWARLSPRESGLGAAGLAATPEFRELDPLADPRRGSRRGRRRALCAAVGAAAGPRPPLAGARRRGAGAARTGCAPRAGRAARRDRRRVARAARARAARGRARGGAAMNALGLRTREDQEREERERLAPWAARAAESLGRVVPEPEHPYRTAFQRDRDRIVHARAFRRLEYKTQV